MYRNRELQNLENMEMLQKHSLTRQGNIILPPAITVEVLLHQHFLISIQQSDMERARNPAEESLLTEPAT
jgi:hypothetical protein